jgi:hypothetical protein
MKTKRDLDRLMGPVFDETDDAAFRKALLQNSVRVSRARHRRVIATRAVAICALILIAGLNLFRPRPGVTVAVAPAQPNALIVATSALLADTLVHTRRDSVQAVTSNPALVTAISSVDHAPDYIVVNDGELLAFLRGQPIALVREPGQAATLVFLEGAETNE